MPMSDDVAEVAARFWADPAVSAARREAVESLRGAGVPDRDVAEAVLREAVVRLAQEETASSIERARAAGVHWARIADAFGLAISTVRHRFDPGTKARRRAYEDRRRDG